MNHRYGSEERNLLLLAAKMLKQYCLEMDCEDCIFKAEDKYVIYCGLQDVPESWCLPNGKREVMKDE